MKKDPAVPQVALAHHWLVSMRGGEKVLEQFCLLFPEAPIYTLVSDPNALSATLRGRKITNSILQRIRASGNITNIFCRFFPM